MHPVLKVLLTVSNLFNIIYMILGIATRCLMPFLIHYLLLPLLVFLGLGLSACVQPLRSELLCITEDKPTASAVCREELLVCDLEELMCCAKKGDVHAQIYLGEMYLTGWKNVQPDAQKAAYWFTQAANCGLSLGQVQIGHLYRDGVGVPRDLTRAICWYKKAADQGDISAMLALGELYKGRYGAKPDYQAAMKWFRMAANLGSYEGELQVAWLLVHGTYGSKGCRQAFDIILHQAKAGNTFAVTQLGDYYYEGYDGCCNLKLARENYEAAACAGSAEAMLKLGLMYSLGQGVCADHEMAAKWVLKAAEQGYLPAQLYLADIYRDGRGLDKNYKLAALWYCRAAEKGSGIAAIELAELVHAGKGVPRQLAEAARLYTLGAEQTHNPYPAIVLTAMYATGRGVPLNLEDSVCWYNTAATHPNFALAEYKLARHYALGFGFKKDLKEALRWYRLSAACGLPIANLDLGDIYYRAAQMADSYERYWLAAEPDFGWYPEECELTYKLYRRAYEHYKKAALKCHPYGQYMIGIMELEGKGVPKNWTAAVSHIRKAAYQGARQAQYQLGILYLRGIGVKQSDTQAYGWLKIALEEVTDITPQVIVHLIDNMDPRAREKAIKLARELECKYQYEATISCPTQHVPPVPKQTCH